jgi:hypothetical protein
MQQEQIQNLLDKYFAGESSLQEEAQLRQLLQNEPLTEEQTAYRTWFQSLDEAANECLNDDFEAKVLHAIEASAAPSAPRIRSLSWQWIGRAAAVFALLAVGLWYLNRSNPVPSKPEIAEVKVIDWSKYEPKTPQEAYEATRNALHKVAKELNEGTAIATQGLGRMEEMGKLIK